MKKNLLAMMCLVVVVLIVSAGCKKSDSGPQQNANVMLVNATPGDSAAYDFYFNDAKLNTQAVKYPSNSGYLALAPKTYNIKIAATNTINPLASGSYNFGSGGNYSVFSYDTLLSGKTKVFATDDDLTAPATGKVKVRFFHLSPVNLAVDILANDSLVFANRSYADNVSDKSKGNFITVNAGTYTVKVKLAGSPSNIAPLLTLNNITFNAGSIYTIFAKGTVSGTGVNALGAEVIVNK